MQQATDYVVEAPRKVRVGMRIRRVENTRAMRHLTLRLSRPSGAKTEVQKIKEGYGDVYVYGWILDGRLEEYIIISMAKLRKSGLLDKPDGIQQNRDGSASFAFWRQETLQDAGVILEGCRYPGAAVEFHTVTTPRH